MTEMGEYLVGAYLSIVERCDVVSYNVRSPEAGLEGMSELDVVAFNLKTKTAFLCEVVTHLEGLIYGVGKVETLDRISKKYRNQKTYAKKYLNNFSHRFQLWSPIVRKGLIEGLERNQGLELCINQEYTRRVNLLRAKAIESSKNTGNPAFRILQILARMRKESQGKVNG